MSTAMLFLETRMRPRIRESLDRQKIRVAKRRSSAADRFRVMVVLDPYNLRGLESGEFRGFKSAVLVASNSLGGQFFEEVRKKLRKRGIGLLGVVDTKERHWGKLLGYLVED